MKKQLRLIRWIVLRKDSSESKCVQILIVYKKIYEVYANIVGVSAILLTSLAREATKMESNIYITTHPSFEWVCLDTDVL